MLQEKSKKMTRKPAKASSTSPVEKWLKAYLAVKISRTGNDAAKKESARNALDKLEAELFKSL